MMNELEELNAGEMEEVAGGALQIPNAVEVVTSGGYAALHSTPENVLTNEIPGSRLYDGEIVIKTEQIKDNMTYVYVMKNGANGWIDNRFLPRVLW